VSQIGGVKERIMDSKECPLKQILELRKVRDRERERERERERDSPARPIPHLV
jgi:hypothetical protein